MKGYMYILECADGSYYTGSTNNFELRLQQHQNGEGANHTKKRLPVKLVYFEEFQRIDEAFFREKQVQGWSRKKKEALIENMPDKLHNLAICLNETHYSNVAFGSAQATSTGSAQATSTGFAQTTDNTMATEPVAERSRWLCGAEATLPKNKQNEIRI